MMVGIAGYSFQRPRSEERLSKTRFLELVAPEDQPQDDLSRTFAQHGISAPSTPDLVNDATLFALRDGLMLSSTSAYVAVSYCWDRNVHEWYDADSDLPILIKQRDGGTKRSGIPPDVLYRALCFAQSRDIGAIWIDQECINQDDPVDKEDAIQSMDMIYEESAHPIAILESWFDKQEQVDIFASIADPDLFEFDPTKIDALCDILEDFVLEKWFTRAWTLQESTSSGVRMVLLIGCPDLEKPECFGPNPDEFEISVWDFQQAMVNARGLIERSLANSDWEDTTDAINASNFADILWNRLPTDTPAEHERMDDYRQRCSAAQAITFLAERHNSVFSDRLAILANLCNFEIRIESKVLDDPSASFSTCALTLAILNGDMSLLVGYADERKFDLAEHGIIAGDQRASRQVYGSDDRNSPHTGFGFTWGPKPTARLDRVSYIENDVAAFRLQPSTLSTHGLKVRGLLWHVDSKIDATDTRSLLQSRQADLLEGLAGDDGNAKLREFTLAFTMQLLLELLRNDFAALARSFWLFLEPWGSSINEPNAWKEKPWLSFPFDQVFGSQTCSTQQESPSASPMLKKLQEKWPLEPYTDADNPHINQQGPIGKLVEQVCGHGFLLGARPFGTPACPATSEPLAWFESTEIDDLVFTPFTALGDAVAIPPYRFQAVSWAVQRTGKTADGCEVLRCLGRRRGYFGLAGLDCADYILE